MTPPKPTSKPSLNYRTKGPLFERVVKRAIQWAFPGAHIYRGQQAVEGGAGESDVETPLLHVEAKWKKLVNYRKAYEQAREDADPAKIPVVVGLDDPDDSGAAHAMVYLSLSDFLCIMHALWEGWGGARVAKHLDIAKHAPPPVSIFWEGLVAGESSSGVGKDASDAKGDDEEHNDGDEVFEDDDVGKDASDAKGDDEEHNDGDEVFEDDD